MKFSNVFRFLAGLLACSFFPAPALATETVDLWIQGGSQVGFEFQRLRGFSRTIGSTVSLYADPGTQKSLSAESLTKILERLNDASEISVYPEMGYADLVRTFFGPFPNVFQDSGRLHVVLLNSSVLELPSTEPYFLPYDQIAEEDAAKTGDRSNQGNFLYVPVKIASEEAVLRSIVKSLPQFSILRHLPERRIFPNWLHHTLAEAALFLGGYYQRDLHSFTNNPHLFSLTQNAKGREGNALYSLFAAFLLDSITGKEVGLKFLSQNANNGKFAVETLFRSDSSRPITFDVIFGNFVIYLFQNEGLNLPVSLVRPGSYEGLPLPPIPPYSEITEFPFVLEAKIYPYGFLSVDLKNPLPPGSVVNLQNVTAGGPAESCAKQASVLWKPINPKKIVIYSVGCNPISGRDLVKFRLNVFDKPSIFPATPLRILPE